VTGGRPGTAALHRLRAAVAGIGSTILTVVGAIAIGAGVPVFWLFVAAQVYGKPGAVTGPVALLIGTGIVLSYWGLLLAGSWVRGRMIASRERGPRRASWNRSMRDARPGHGHGRIDPIERVFIAATALCLIGFGVWFFAFAGAPVPG